MRIEVDVLENSPEAAVLRSVSDPRAYVLELIRADHSQRAKEVQTNSPDYNQILGQAQKSPNRFQTREEIDTHLHVLRSEW